VEITAVNRGFKDYTAVCHKKIVVNRGFTQKLFPWVCASFCVCVRFRSHLDVYLQAVQVGREKTVVFFLENLLLFWEVYFRFAEIDFRFRKLFCIS
jgi:hypothetical protein